MTLQPLTEPFVHPIPARALDGSAGQPGSEGRLGRLAGSHSFSKAPKARTLTDRREAANPMMETRQ